MQLFGMPNLLRDYLSWARSERETRHTQLLRVHGNGFIQFDIDNKTRLHFWGDPRIPRQRVDSGWHEHNFSIFSTVLMGKLTHITYRTPSDYGKRGQFYGYIAAQQPGTENTMLKRIVHSDDVTPATFDLVIDETFQIKEGETYGFQRGRVHYSSASLPTITLKTNTAPELSRPVPVIYCPIGLEPDNEFHRDGFDQAMLWDIVMDMVN